VREALCADRPLVAAVRPRDPMSRNCRAPRAILERYKVNLETGERRSPPRAPA
jgi:hypothetical protein